MEAGRRRIVLDLTSQRAEAVEPDPQGATCGDLERRASWDHDDREPVGFGRTTCAPGQDGRPVRVPVTGGLT